MTEENRDENGRIIRPYTTKTRVQTCKTSITHAHPDRTVTHDTLPTGPYEKTIEYLPPFDTCDREEDYETVWAEFERR